MLSSDGETGPAIPTPDAQEFKTYTFEYSLFPHRKDWRQANSFKPAYEFNHSLIGLQMPVERRKKTKTLPGRFSFFEVKPENVILTALKKAEDSNEVVLRLFETKGERTRAEIDLFKEPRSVKVINLLEMEEREIKFKGKRIKLRVKPFEIVSLKIGF
jgi:alpha-mannosidase